MHSIFKALRLYKPLNKLIMIPISRPYFTPAPTYVDRRPTDESVSAQSEDGAEEMSRCTDIQLLLDEERSRCTNIESRRRAELLKQRASAIQVDGSGTSNPSITGSQRPNLEQELAMQSIYRKNLSDAYCMRLSAGYESRRQIDSQYETDKRDHSRRGDQIRSEYQRRAEHLEIRREELSEDVYDMLADLARYEKRYSPLFSHGAAPTKFKEQLRIEYHSQDKLMEKQKEELEQWYKASLSEHSQAEVNLKRYYDWTKHELSLAIERLERDYRADKLTLHKWRWPTQPKLYLITSAPVPRTSPWKIDEPEPSGPPPGAPQPPTTNTVSPARRPAYVRRAKFIWHPPAFLQRLSRGITQFFTSLYRWFRSSVRP